MSSQQVGPTSNVFPSFALGCFSVGVTRHKLVVSRNDRPGLPHFTISWGNKSGLIDLHLTYERVTSTIDGVVVVKDHGSVATLSPSKLEALAPYLQKFVEKRYVLPAFREFRRYRPGWLGRKGYVVPLQDEAELLAWLTSIAPKQRGKYRVDTTKLISVEQYPRSLVELYSARVLGLIDPESIVKPVFAPRIVRGRLVDRGALVLNHIVGPDGRLGWWGFREGFTRGMSRRVWKAIDEELRPHLRPHHVEVFNKIAEGLALHEVDDLRGGIVNLRAFLSGEAPRLLALGPHRDRAK